MIYKNGIKVDKIELVIEDNLICHIHLSNGKVWSLKPKTPDPTILFNKEKLELFCINTLGLSLKQLSKEMEK